MYELHDAENPSKLLVNNRAYGNLHRLPSDIFYDLKHPFNPMCKKCILVIRSHFYL